MLILFRSLCTEENIYSIEPIYPPYKPLYYMYMHIMILSFLGERTEEIKFSFGHGRRDTKGSATRIPRPSSFTVAFTRAPFALPVPASLKVLP